MDANEVRMEIIKDLNRVDDISLLKTIREMLHYGLENNLNLESSHHIDYPEMTVELQQVLDERLEYHRLHPNEGASWEEVKARIKK